MPKMKIGYARASTKAQTLDPQIEELRRYGCERIFSDKITGSKMDRPGLSELYLNLRPGDEFVVVALDRIGRDLVGVMEVIEKVRSKGVKVVSLSQKLDFDTAYGRFIIQVTLSFAELEKALINERIQRGIKLAKGKGVRFGRKKGETKADVKEVANTYIELRGEGLKHSEAQKEIASKFGLSITAIHRYLDQEEKILKKAGFPRPTRKKRAKKG